MSRVLPSLRARVCVLGTDETARTELRAAVSRQGHETLGTPNLDHALEWRGDVHLVQVDADTAAAELQCERIKHSAVKGYNPVIAVLLHNDADARARLWALGIDDVLVPPIGDLELSIRIDRVVRRTRGANAVADSLGDISQELLSAREDLHRAQYETVERLARAAHFRDDETAAHLQRMSRYSYLLALRAGLSEYEAQMLRSASPMHDVGKIGIPDAILLKRGKLTPEEYAVMQRHAQIGYEILSGSDSPVLRLAADVALTHHEKWDGSGYPNMVAGADIPLAGRIVAIADVFDALTTERPYKRAWTIEAAVKYLRDGAGRHFDPELVELFLRDFDQVLDIRAKYADAPPTGEHVLVTSA